MLYNRHDWLHITIWENLLSSHNRIGLFPISPQIHQPSLLKSSLKNIILDINIYRYLAWKDSTCSSVIQSKKQKKKERKIKKCEHIWKGLWHWEAGSVLAWSPLAVLNARGKRILPCALATLKPEQGQNDGCSKTASAQRHCSKGALKLATAAVVSSAWRPLKHFDRFYLLSLLKTFQKFQQVAFPHSDAGGCSRWMGTSLLTVWKTIAQKHILELYSPVWPSATCGSKLLKVSS